MAELSVIGNLHDIDGDLEEYDYIRLSFVDLNGVIKSVLLSRRNVKRHLEKGFDTYAGVLLFGSIGELIAPQELLECRFGNGLIAPDYSTLHPLPQRNEKSKHIGQIFGEIRWHGDKPQEACPRYMARKQLHRLDEMGYSFYSGTEVEFLLLDKATSKPVFATGWYMNSYLLGEFEPWYIDLDEALDKAGVPVYSTHIEYGPGQFEIPTSPEFGIIAADHWVILRQCLKEVSSKWGYVVNIMAHYLPYGKAPTGSGAHSNFSVWDKERKNNIFWDESSPEGLSDFAYHWIAGLMKHASALAAIFCPTTNCYGRLKGKITPTYINWGMENRTAMIRTKNKGPSGTYVENRLTSGLANPYLVMACTIAAGLDGVKNTTACPEPHQESVVCIPGSLEEALDALKNDEVMVDALGKEFVEWFCAVKQVDIDAIKDAKDEAEQLNIEIDRLGTRY